MPSLVNAARARTGTVATLMLLAASVPAAAQDSAAARIRDAAFSPLAATASPRGEVTGGAPQVFVTSEWGQSTAKITGGFNLKRTGSMALELKLGLETAVAEGDREAVIADLHRLGGATTVTFGLTGSRWKQTGDVAPSKLLEWCTTKRKAGQLESAFDCNSFSSAALPRALRLDFLNSAGWSEPLVYDLKAKVGRASMDYLDSATFAPTTIERTAWSAGGSVGRFFSAGPLQAALFSAGVDYKVGYSDRTSVQVCSPTGTTGAMLCQTGPRGEPGRNERSVANVEIRGFLKPRVGIGPQFLIDLQNREWQVDAPIYFLPNAAGALIAGIAPSYLSTGNEWGLRVFVGATGFGLQ